MVPHIASTGNRSAQDPRLVSQDAAPAAWVTSNLAFSDTMRMIEAAMQVWRDQQEKSGARAIARASRSSIFEVLGFLQSVGCCWMKVDTIASRMGRSPRTIRFALGILRRAGLITRRARYRDGHQRTSITKVVRTIQRAIYNAAFFKPQQAGRAGGGVSTKRSNKMKRIQKPRATSNRRTDGPVDPTTQRIVDQIRRIQQSHIGARQQYNRQAYPGRGDRDGSGRLDH